MKHSDNHDIYQRKTNKNVSECENLSNMLLHIKATRVNCIFQRVSSTHFFLGKQAL